MSIEQKLYAIEQRYEELEQLISDPAVMEKTEEWQKYTKEHSDLYEITEKIREYRKLVGEDEDALEMSETESDPEMRELFRAEHERLKKQTGELYNQLIQYLIPKNPDDDKNVILEIRAGAGGDEAALFGSVLMRMYARYAERRGWKMSVMSSNITDMGGVKEAVCEICGKGVYERLKFESGVHRVQRVPVTESGGRIHTSTATVAVMPEADEIDSVDINPNDIRIDTFRASGHGGQYINMTDSAVRITHLPTGLVVSCQDEKSQLKNKEKAMQVLRSRLLAKLKSEQQEEYTENRRTLIGSGDRSEKIRTYNFPQGRVSDHRINFTMYDIDGFIDGNMDSILDELAARENAEKLANMSQW